MRQLWDVELEHSEGQKRKDGNLEQRERVLEYEAEATGVREEEEEEEASK